MGICPHSSCKDSAFKPPKLGQTHHIHIYVSAIKFLHNLLHLWATVCKTVRPVISDRCPVLSVTLVYCGQTVGWIKMKLGMAVGLGPGHIVLDGDPSPPPPKGHSPQFLAHVYCGQMAGWIKMPLGMEVGSGPGDIVLDGDPALPLKGAQLPNFRPMSIVAKRMDGSRCLLLWW